MIQGLRGCQGLGCQVANLFANNISLSRLFNIWLNKNHSMIDATFPISWNISKKNRIRLYTKTSTDLCNKFKMQHVKQHLPATQIPGFKRLRKQTLQMFLAHGRFQCYRSQVWWSGFLLKTTIFEGHDLREFHIEERRTNSPIDSDSPQTAGIFSCVISKKNVKQKSHFKESFSTISYLYLCHSANLYIYIHKSYIHINYICI